MLAQLLSVSKRDPWLLAYTPFKYHHYVEFLDSVVYDT